MLNQRFHTPAHLFTLRLWYEDLGEGQREWRGRVKHLGNGQVRYFRDPETLYDVLRLLLVCAQEDSDLPEAVRETTA